MSHTHIYTHVYTHGPHTCLHVCAQVHMVTEYCAADGGHSSVMVTVLYDNELDAAEAFPFTHHFSQHHFF